MIHKPRRRWFNLSENNALLLLAVAVGGLTGVSILIFRAGIELAHELFVVGLGQGVIGNALASVNVGREWAGVVVLAVVGALVGWLMGRFVGEEKYHGVAGVMESVALAGGRLPYRKMPFKAVASMLSIGGGASVGPEDPSVQIGSNVGSWVGQSLHLSEARVRLLVSAGAASAVASAFNAPIAGVFFALEIILGEFSAGSFGVVVLSAVISAGITQTFRGGSPIFDGLVGNFALADASQFFFCALLGALLGVFCALSIRYHAWQGRVLHALNLPRPLKTAMVGAFVGVVGAFFPQILGAGEAFMHDILNGHLTLDVSLLLALGFLKLTMTAISQGGGFVGGVFAPSLFMGIVLGQAYGMTLNSIGLSSATPQSYAIAGMAGVMAGIVRAPITAILIVFEITRDYTLILPIMLTAVLCAMTAERMGTAGIYMLSLLKHGVRLQQGRDIDLMQGMTVQEAMVSPAPTIPQSATLEELRDAFRAYHTRALCVIDGDTLVGIVTLGDLQAAFERALRDPALDASTLRVADVCTRDVVTCATDDVLWTAIQNMGARDIGRLPVIDGRTGALVGVLRRQDIMQAYNIAMSRKLHDQHTAEQVRLHTLTGAHVLSYFVRQDSPLVGQAISAIKFPPECVVASIQRKDKLIVPHGSTILRAGDTLTIVADPDSEHVLNAMFG
jgi:CIC family chloride channel protein